MALHLHRSPRTELLLQALVAQLRQGWPDDPLESVPIMVGSRGMERWLRHRLAEDLGIAAALDFPFPRPALEGAIAWLLDAAAAPRAAYWQTAAALDDPWQADALALRLLPLLRARAAAPPFAAVARYLGYGGDAAQDAAVSARELQFARQVADTLDRLLHERPADLARWPQQAPAEHAWLADLLEALRQAIDAADPAARLQQLAARPAPEGALRTLHVFGMSTLGIGELLRIEQLARHLDLHLYLLTPTALWWQDVRAPRQARLALRRARTAAQLDQTLEELATQNPLLAGLGQPSQFLQRKLEEIDYQDHDVAPPPPPAAPPPLLAQLQQWIVDAEPPRRAAEPPRWRPDPSLQFHSTYGPLRQVEVLRDRLLDLLARQPRWTARDILVMTPDVPTFAPLVAAVFARSGPQLPVEIADLGLAAGNPVAEAAVAVLRLAGERVTAAQLLDLLQLAPLRQRFAIAADDLPTLRALARDAAMSWGFDAADRARHDQPAIDQNTVRFGLERLALGALLADDDAALVEGPPMALQPCPVGGSERLALLGRWMALVATLRWHCERLRAPRPLAQWHSDVLAALDDLTAPTPKTGYQHTQVAQALEQLAAHADSCPLAIERDALLRWLSGRFEVPQHGDRPIGGAIQMCALEPMRSVPFKVVALLGMDDGAFPRAEVAPSWDPFAAARPGERDRRAGDRHLLLEALLCAREALVVLWSGRSATSGKALPAAVPIEELLAVVAQQSGHSRDALVVQHPLQPWSPRCFAPGPAQSFSADMAAAARGLDGVRRGAQPPRPLAWSQQVAAPLPEEAEPVRHLTTEALARGLANPSRVLLRDRLGLASPAEEAPLPEREPLELEHLDTWGLRQRLLEVLAQETAPLEQLRDHPEPWLQRELRAAAGRGELPLQAGGQRLLRGQWQQALQALAQARAVEGAVEVRGPWSLQLGALALHTPARPARQARCGGVLQQLVASGSPSPRAQLAAWVQLLAVRAADPQIAAAQLACAGETSTWIHAPAPHRAAASATGAIPSC